MDFWKSVKVETFRGVLKPLSEFTQEELIYEKVKCATDSIHVIETYFYIFDQTKNNNKGEIVPFKLFPFQKDLVKSYENNRFNITNKYRQAGISTVTCAWLATYITFNSNRSVAIVANKLETARDELMKDVTGFIDMLPPFLHPKISDKNAANHKIYMNGSQVKAFATNSLRGYTPTFLFWDEAAWCDNGEAFWTGTLPTLSTGGNAALVSCVTKDTMVWTDNGLIEIDELIDHTQKGAYFVDEYNVLGKDKKRSGKIIKNNGFNSTIKIETEHVSLEGTISHKLWSYNANNGNIGYNILRYTKVDDYVALQYNTNIFGNLSEIKEIKTYTDIKPYDFKLTESFIDFLGLYYYKGDFIKLDGLNRYNLIIKSISDDDFNIINKFLTEYKSDYPELYNDNLINFNNGDFSCTINAINNIFYRLDLYKQLNRSFSNRILSGPIKKFEGAYLKRLAKSLIKLNPDKIIDTDKFSAKFNNVTMGRQIQQILLNGGIISSYDSYIRMARSMNNIDRYLIIDLDYNYFIDSENYDPIIFDQTLPLGILYHVRNVLEKYGINIPFGVYKRFQLVNIIDKLKDLLSEEDIIKLDGYVSKNIYWSKVKKVEKNRAYTYDFSLPKNDEDPWAHSVIYNGILGHQTPNGLDPVFYKTYNNAKNGVSDFVANELYWYYDPRYGNDLYWKKKNKDGVEIIHKEPNKDNYKKLINDGWKPSSPWFESMAAKFNNDKKKIAQELECSFLGSGNNFIDEEHIRRIEESQIKDPIRMEYDEFFWIWEDPIKDKSYVMTVDVSTGAGDDYSTIIILKQHETHLEQVAEFKHKVSPDTLGVIANDYGRRYNNAFAIVDITGGIGAMTMKTILDLGYTNVHYTVNRHEPTKEKLNDYTKEDENGKTLVPGFVISTSNRGMVLTEMKRAVESNEIEIKSYRLISEFKTFVTTTNNRIADHRRSFNDDLIIALAMGVYVFSYDIRSVGMSIEKTKKMLTAITSTVSDYNTGNQITNNTTFVDPSNPYVANSWLFRGLKK
jgi:hypothetical protein